MWKKSFVQNGNLLSHLTESSEPRTIINTFNNNDNTKEELFLDDEKYVFDTWDATKASKEEWTTEKLCDFLGNNPSKVPMLKRILKTSKNPYNMSPHYLCEFKAINGEVQLWLPGAILYNVDKYKKKIVAAKKKL